MQKSQVALVTGANKGIGRQIAKELASRGVKVFIGSRDLAAGLAAAEEVEMGTEAIQLDVTKPESIASAAKQIEAVAGRLDILINNAGISQQVPADMPLQERMTSGYLDRIPVEDMRTVFETNVFGVVAVTQAMLPLLRRAPAGRIVNISSITGSLAVKADPNHPMHNVVGAYSCSKTALNAVTQSFAVELAGTNIKVNSVCPGFTSTAISNFAEGAGTVEDAAREPVRLALIDAEGPTGTFSDYAGIIAW